MAGINHRRRSRKYRRFGLRELLLAVIAFYFWPVWYNHHFFSNDESAIAIAHVNTTSYTVNNEIVQSKWHPVESFHNVMKTNNCRVLKSCIQYYPECPMGCKCFCDNLCKIQPVSNITRYMTMNNKSSPKDRLIPKIIHQTWKNPVTKEEYPNMSRFVQSWQQSGWSYVFYDDDDAASFIASNFPSEVKEAYDALIPGAFKADFFRYCILFIHGGVYADIDILCTCDLDSAIDSDVSFLVPIDLAPGKNGNSCLWNGLIASAPGHPFLKAAIETMVNHIRHRFVSIDTMNVLCHEGTIQDPVIYWNHQDLYTTGPCFLGFVVNKFLGRPPQSGYLVTTSDTNSTLLYTIDKREYFDRAVNQELKGKVVFLGMKNEMGAIRFTLQTKNMLMASTSFQGDTDEETKRRSTSKHYSSMMKSQEIFGTSDLYVNDVEVTENVQFIGYNKNIG